MSSTIMTTKTNISVTYMQMSENLLVDLPQERLPIQFKTTSLSGKGIYSRYLTVFVIIIIVVVVFNALPEASDESSLFRLYSAVKSLSLDHS